MQLSHRGPSLKKKNPIKHNAPWKFEPAFISSSKSTVEMICSSGRKTNTYCSSCAEAFIQVAAPCDRRQQMSKQSLTWFLQCSRDQKHGRHIRESLIWQLRGEQNLFTLCISSVSVCLNVNKPMFLSVYVCVLFRTQHTVLDHKLSPGWPFALFPATVPTVPDTKCGEWYTTTPLL